MERLDLEFHVDNLELYLHYLPPPLPPSYPSWIPCYGISSTDPMGRNAYHPYCLVSNPLCKLDYPAILIHRQSFLPRPRALPACPRVHMT